MGISGRKSKMRVGGSLDGAVVKFTETMWEAKESRNGKDNVNLKTSFVDADDQSHEKEFFLSSQRFVNAEDGKLVTVDEQPDYQISGTSAAGKILSSLEDAGFSPKKLDNIGDAPEALDGTWARLKEKPSNRMKDDGTPFTDLIVEEIVDDPTSGKGKGGKKAEKASGKAKASSKVVEEDDEDEDADVETDEDEDEDSDENTDEDEDEETDEDDPIATLARDTTVTLLSSPAEYVKNFDEDAADGGVTVKQAYTASFGMLKGAGKQKGPASSMINDPSFHKANAKAGLYQFESKTGVLMANQKKGKGKK